MREPRTYALWATSVFVALVVAFSAAAQDAKPFVVAPQTPQPARNPFAFQLPSMTNKDIDELNRKGGPKGPDDLNHRPLGKSPAEKATEAKQGADRARKRD